MIIIDWIAVKSIERKLNRKLSEAEILGTKKIKVSDQFIQIDKVYILWLHSKNSCK